MTEFSVAINSPHGAKNSSAFENQEISDFLIEILAQISK